MLAWTLVLLTMPVMVIGLIGVFNAADWTAFASTDRLVLMLDKPRRDQELVPNRLLARAAQENDPAKMQWLVHALLVRQQDLSKPWNPKLGLLLEHAFERGHLSDAQAGQYVVNAWQASFPDNVVDGEYLNIRHSDEISLSFSFECTRGAATGPAGMTLSPRLSGMLGALVIESITVDGRVIHPDKADQLAGFGEFSPPGKKELIGSPSFAVQVLPNQVPLAQLPGSGPPTLVRVRCLAEPAEETRRIKIRARVRAFEPVSANVVAGSWPRDKEVASVQTGILGERATEIELLYKMPPKAKPVRWLRGCDLAKPLASDISISGCTWLEVTFFDPKNDLWNEEQGLHHATIRLVSSEPITAHLIGRLELRRRSNEGEAGEVVAISSEYPITGSVFPGIHKHPSIRLANPYDSTREGLSDLVSLVPIPDEPLELWYVPNFSARTAATYARGRDPAIESLFMEETLLGVTRLQPKMTPHEYFGWK